MTWREIGIMALALAGAAMIGVVIGLVGPSASGSEVVGREVAQ